MYGYHGKILQVDLTNNRVREKKLTEKFIKKYIGGKGFGLKSLLEMFSDKQHDAFSPDSPLIYMTGPFTDMGIPGSGRHGVFGKSPLTNYLGESYAGGFFARGLKRTGYDGIIISGKSDIPQYLIITPEDVKIGNAYTRGLIGRYPSVVQDILSNKYGKDLKVSAIGPAGERLVRFAAIINDRNRANGRCGLGAIMGFKNLKAIGVLGNVATAIYDQKRFKAARKRYIDNLNNNTNLENFGKYGTPDLVDTLNERGILPTRNFQSGEYYSASSISGKTLYDKLLTDRDNCSFCGINCKRVVQGKFGTEEILPIYGGPEYETIAAFGSLLENENLESICLANQKCNQYGLDTISTGNVIAFAMEASGKGLIKEKIEWGDASAMIKLIDDINERQGLGKFLGEGVMRFSQKIGGEEFAVCGKGLETAMHEPRGKVGLGMSYAVSPRGTHHLEGLHDTMIENPNSSPELGATEAYSRFSLKNKIGIVKNFEDVRSFTNCLIQCVFTVTLSGKNYNVKFLREMYSGITGFELDAEEMLERGAMVYNMGREFSWRQGLRSKDDGLPQRFTNEELTFGDKKVSLTEKIFRKRIQEYYELRGWDSEGRPKQIR